MNTLRIQGLVAATHTPFHADGSLNLAGPIYLRVIAAFQRGDFTAAREDQMKSVRVIQTLASRAYMGVAKTVMAMLGVEVGPPRLPSAALDAAQTKALRAELDNLDFFNQL